MKAKVLTAIFMAMMVIGCSKKTDTKEVLDFKEAVLKSYVCSTDMILEITEAATDYHNGKHYFSADFGNMVADEDVDYSSAVIREYDNLSVQELASIMGKKEGEYKNCVRCYSQSEAAYCKKQLFELLHLYNVGDSLLDAAKALLPQNKDGLAALVICVTSLHELSKYEDADYQKLLLQTKSLIDVFEHNLNKSDSLYEETHINVRNVQKEVRDLIKSKRGVHM